MFIKTTDKERDKHRIRYLRKSEIIAIEVEIPHTVIYDKENPEICENLCYVSAHMRCASEDLEAYHVLLVTPSKEKALKFAANLLDEIAEDNELDDIRVELQKINGTLHILHDTIQYK